MGFLICRVAAGCQWLVVHGSVSWARPGGRRTQGWSGRGDQDVLTRRRDRVGCFGRGRAGVPRQSLGCPAPASQKLLAALLLHWGTQPATLLCPERVVRPRRRLLLSLLPSCPQIIAWGLRPAPISGGDPHLVLARGSSWPRPATRPPSSFGTPEAPQPSRKLSLEPPPPARVMRERLRDALPHP